MAVSFFNSELVNYQQLFESLPERYIVLDPSLRVLSATEGYLNVTLTQRPQVIGQHVFDVFPSSSFQLPSSDIDLFQNALNRVIYERVPYVLPKQHYTFRRPASDYDEDCYWNLKNKPLLDERGDVRLIIHSVEDITNVVQLEDVTQQRLDSVNVALDEFLAVAGHELKTPITSLRGYAQFLLRLIRKGQAPDEAQLHRALTTIDQESLKLSYTVDQLLDISRINAGQLVLYRAEADVASLVYAVVATIKRQYPVRLFTVDIQEPLKSWVDSLRIKQVLTNVLLNAVKFSPDGGSIDITAHQTSPHWLEISITDHGVGITPEHRPYMFNRFYQAHQAGYFSGMGVSLSISRHIIELHGGTITAEFPPDGGTRIVVRLPLENIEQHPAGTRIEQRT